MADGLPVVGRWSRKSAGVLAAELLLEQELTGEWGNDLALAVIDFQKSHGLKVDGIIGPKTWAALLWVHYGFEV